MYCRISMCAMHSYECEMHRKKAVNKEQRIGHHITVRDMLVEENFNHR